MGRVEETNEVTRAIEEGTTSNFKKAYWAKTSHEMSGAIQIEIAKSLAQLADDIHFLREYIAEELKREEKPKPSGPKCLRCAYYEKTTVDNNGLIRNDVDWCMWYRRPIDLTKGIDCYKFIKADKETGG